MSGLRSLRVIKKNLSSSSKRNFATVVNSNFNLSEASGIKVASIEDGAPTSAISVIIKAGSRFESSPGLSHVLKNSLFKVKFIFHL